ncbi:MAG: hypothetical protein CMB52_02595 [Euryarchaeota archaeon]|nr:hypothetical protein [Euryarchaeota archaeon]|tara:strand:- start:3633 stop:4352 length:720 start_codon:yes stop_codon:yes gene_type:complete
MNRQLFNDYYLRKAIITGVILVVCSCIISQVMMQLGGGLRDEPLDLSDQVPEDFEGGEIVFENGFPPFISSAGAFMPEKLVFNFGLFSGGLIMIFLSFELFHRTKPNGRKRDFSNVVALVTGIIIGFSMIQIVAYPFNTDIMLHIFWAMNIFWGAQVWIASLTYARGEIDSEIEWKGWEIHKVRWAIFAIAIISFQSMTILTALSMLVESAIFEWTLTFAAQAMMLTFIPTLDSTPSAD